MTVLVSDYFDRTDANPIGAPWTTTTSDSAMKILSNTAQASSLATDCGSWISGTYPNDQWAQGNITCTTSASTGGTGPCLMVRVATGARTWYRVSFNHGGTTNIQLAKFVTGTFTALWTRLATFNDGDLCRLEVRGTTLRVFIKGVQVGADQTDAAVTAGQPGIGYSSASTTALTIDNFTAGDFGNSLVVEQAAIQRAHYW